MLWAEQMDYMARALQLASRALGSVSPNPAVGAVLVRDGRIAETAEALLELPEVAEVYSVAGAYDLVAIVRVRQYEQMAEVVALRAAGPLARHSTLYVTLEPCAHFGRTPPCADALVAAGVAEAHVAMLDPSPWVNGNGIAALEQAGIRVSRGSHEQEAQRLNEAYLCWLRHGRPLVTALYALCLDGHARPPGDAGLGAAASAELARLRATADRTVTAVDDLLAEDPALTGLATSGVTALHVEAPPRDLDALAERGLLDRVMVFVSPTLGAAKTSGPAGSAPIANPSSDAPAVCSSTLHTVTYERLGDAVLVTGYLPDSAPLPQDARPAD